MSRVATLANETRKSLDQTLQVDQEQTMSTAGNTPNFIAGTSIPTFACVRMKSSFEVENTTAADAKTNAFVGVTDGSVRAFNKLDHAQQGDPVVLQNGQFVQLKCAGSYQIFAGQLVTFDAGGTVRPINTNELERAFFVASENAEYGEIFWAQRVGAYDYLPVQLQNLNSADPVVTNGASTETTDLESFVPPNAIVLGQSACMSLLVLGSNSTGTTTGAYRFATHYRYYNNSGAQTFAVVSTEKVVVGETNAALNANIAVNNNKVQLEVTGVTGETMSWRVIAQKVIV